MLEISEVPTKMSFESAYLKVILRKPKLMHLTRCNASNEFVSILADLYLKSSLSSVESKNALKAATVLCQSVLQKVGSRKISTIRKILERRMWEWKSGHILELFTEAHILQEQKMREIKLASKNDKVKWQKDFLKLMKTGKTSSAIFILKSGDKQKGIHTLNTIFNAKTERNILTELHPDPRVQEGSELLRAEVFKNTGIDVTSDGVTVLVIALGSVEYCERIAKVKFMKVYQWYKDNNSK
ncbi:hypothetical protein GJ496_009813 [Pomphorhynchus laevis]|nr:hypothetical protein GJ496_009813 [Pomphorhynchus laevis]